MANTEEKRVREAYGAAKERYADIGVDADAALAKLARVSLSLPCWQLDDVQGFEDKTKKHDGGGTLVTGSYPGAARNGDELRRDADEVLANLPGKHRLNLHAIYAEGQGRTDRDEILPEHFSRWMDWAASRGIGLDFNPTYFGHPKAASGFTLSSPDEGIRAFWLRHGVASRGVSEAIGKRLGSACIMNTWIPDGFKDAPIDRAGYRGRLEKSLDTIFARPIDGAYMKDAVESKLFGIGAESCTVGSHEFYLCYAQSRKKLVCLDTGHFHPTEQIGDKISAILRFNEGMLLHLSRPVRWDSDHVAIQDGETELIAQEIARNDYLDRVSLSLDFFDATINRVAALVIGARAMLRSFCRAYLEPSADLAEHEKMGDLTYRLAMQEELKALPWQAVWDYYCIESGAPAGRDWIERATAYEKGVIAERS
jgi:L-rhamnose isomerase